MEKIIQISINATIFSLEETAYNKLSSYLREINDAFKDEAGGQEIIKDIESRVAEHLKDKNVQFITMEIVDEVISKMGTVSELTEGKEVNHTEKTKEESFDKNRKLFRDEENAVLGGVCSGIAAYFDVDPTWVRIAFIALAIFGFGFIIPIYIILWLIVPAAETSSDKLEMHGNQVTLNTIADTVRNRISEVSGKSTCKKHKEGKCIPNFGEKLGNIIRKIFNAFGKTIRVFIGAMLAIGGLGMIIGSAAAATALFTADMSNEIYDFIAQTNAEPFIAIGAVAMSILIAIPALFIFFGGIAVVLKKPIMHIKYGLLILGVWMIALVTVVVLGTHFGIRFEKYISTIHNQQNLNHEVVQEIIIAS